MSQIRSQSINPRDNELLAALPQESYRRLAGELEFVAMPTAEILVESHCRPAFVYFPVTSVVSAINDTEDGHATDIALIGREGVAGFEFFASGQSSNARAVTRCGGHGYRLRSGFAQSEFERNQDFMTLVFNFVQALTVQVSQAAVCNRFHSARQQMCRWLLMAWERVGSDELEMTQEQIGEMIGVRRETVSEIASDLQQQDIIRYRRGRLSILDSERLADSACECHALIRKEYAHVLGTRRPPVQPERPRAVSVKHRAHSRPGDRDPGRPGKKLHS